MICERYIYTTRDLACNPGTCPDWELNRRPFASQARAQSTEPHQPGLHHILKEFCAFHFLSKHVINIMNFLISLYDVFAIIEYSCEWCHYSFRLFLVTEYTTFTLKSIFCPSCFVKSYLVFQKSTIFWKLLRWFYASWHCLTKTCTVWSLEAKGCWFIKKQF